MSNPGNRKAKWCWLDEKTGAVHLTMSLKRQILTSNVFGVDIDPGAVEVTQLSLYLKMLENENRNTLQLQRELLPDDDDPLLPPLENNVKCGNSLIASDFSMIRSRPCWKPHQRC
jgi:adenine-specific DNA-methyltransferase